MPRTQALQYTLRAGENEDEDEAEDAAEVDSLVSSDEDLGVLEDEDDDQGVLLPPEDSISGYKTLVALDLRSNSIATLRDEVGRMQSLCSVYMCHNDIRVLPNALASLCNLKNLVATHNYIKQLPADFGELKASLKVLELGTERSEWGGGWWNVPVLARAVQRFRTARADVEVLSVVEELRAESPSSP